MAQISLRVDDDMERRCFDGIGKPEPLKGELSGFWSRRIDDANRFVYQSGTAYWKFYQAEGTMTIRGRKTALFSLPDKNFCRGLDRLDRKVFRK